MLKIPSFLVIGAAKSGTTSLYHYLKQHPQIYMTPRKETNFFAFNGENVNYRGPGDDIFVNRKAITSIAAYQEQFAGVINETATGEISPLYLYHNLTAERIAKYIPEVCIIAILRNPVSRAISSFLHLIRDNRETTLDFGEALELENERIRGNWEHIWHYIQMGFYYKQLLRYYSVFRSSQIKIFLYEDFTTNPNKVMSDIFQFIQVDPFFCVDMSQRYNVSQISQGKIPLIHQDSIDFLIKTYTYDILRLQDIIGRDLSLWLKK